MNKLCIPRLPQHQYWVARVAWVGMFLALLAFGAFSQAPTAHASSHIAADCSSPCRQSSQLVFLDYRTDIYSIRVIGANQYGTSTVSPCWQTPSFETVFYNWWWASDTVVYLYHTSDCGAYIGYLTIKSDGAWYRCLQDTYPYPDYDCNP